MCLAFILNIEEALNNLVSSGMGNKSHNMG